MEQKAKRIEHKTRKMLALGAVIMLCAVAIIGAGYAAFAGSARTYNQGNSVDVGNITMGPTGSTVAEKWAAISTTDNKEVFGTYRYVTEDVTPVEKTAYYFNVAGDTIDDGGVADGYTVKQVASKDFIITNDSGSAISAINFKVKASADTPAGDFKYFLKVTIGTTVTYLNVSTAEQETTAKAIAIAAAAGSTGTISVAICVGYVANVYIPATFIGPATTTATAYPAIDSSAIPADLENVSFAFEVLDASS